MLNEIDGSYLYTKSWFPKPSERSVSICFQDLLFLACSHPENRNSLIEMEEWPEWILEILISNYEVIIVTLH